MKEFLKKYRNILIGIILSIIVIVVIVIVYRIFTNENALTIDEKKWIDENTSVAVNINIVNDVNIFGNNAEGVFYDFLADFTEDYEVNVNLVTYKYGESVSGITLGVTTNVSENDVVFYTDHYVVISKSYEYIYSYDDLSSETCGIVDENIKDVYDGQTKTYTDEEALISAFESGEVEYIIVPRYLYADYIISEDYYVIYHMSDINYYYTLNTDDSTLSSIITKYFNGVWSNYVYDSFKDSEFDLYVSSLGLTESQTDKLTSEDYTYGFVENSPYEVISSGNFGGVSAVLLSEFSEFANVEFEFVKFKNYSELTTAIEDGSVDVFLNKYTLSGDFSESINGYNSEFYVVARRDNFVVVNSLSGLSGKTVYAEENTKIYAYLENVSGINLISYSKEEELFDLNSEDCIIVIDSNSFDFYSSSDLDNYTKRYTFVTDFSSNYAVNTDDALFILLDEYTNLADDEEIIIKGIDNHYDTISLGMLIASLAKYILIFIIIVLVIIIVIIKKSKKIQLAIKIKKEDKLKYIDQLTSLKNRNYFNDCKESWNNNTIYPQSIIIIDLNKIQKINDQFGYGEGDKQIKAFANALIRSQLDNSEIMRTDGNEFVIYLVGYSQKQIVNYIHKLNKEVDKLPYGEGAKFGYDMILDDLKTVEDSLNDAANDMIEKNKNEEKI